MVKKSSSSSKLASLFDIRLKNHEHDVLVLKGSPQDAASALLSGKIALSVKEPFTIKKLSLRLYATLRLDWKESVNTAKGSSERSIHHERKIYEYNWDNMEIHKYLNNMYENSTNDLSQGSIVGNSIGLSRNSSSSSLKNLGAGFRSKSSNNLSSLSSLSKTSPSNSSTNLSHSYSSSSNNNSITNNNLNSGANSANKNSTHNLVQGNYEFPFSTIVPGSMPESVEGLPGASVIYKLEATIDRGKFHLPMVTKKHLRVVRTLTTDSVELSESVAVDNTWPKKVEYSLNVPSKAIAVGSGVPITLMLVPLLKGLRLGETKISLIEYYSYMGYVPPVRNGERVIVTKTIPKPIDDDPNFQLDKWQVDTVIKVPPSLSKCTQDVDILTNIKVRHKIKFAIGLVNPDGHVSELRASLPISLFISPFVTVRALTDVESKTTGKTTSSTSASHTQHDLVPDEEEEEEIFTSDRTHGLTQNLSNSSLSNINNNGNGSNLHSNSSSYSSFSGLVAPPLYEAHIYDRLWTDVSPIDSPLNSGTSTPRNAYSNSNGTSSNSGMQDFNMSPIDSVQLNENLRLLSLQRQSENSTPTLERNGGATFSLEAENNNSTGDYFGRPTLSSRNTTSNLSTGLSSHVNLGLMSPGIPSPAIHLSRTQSETVLNSSEMFQVPSYTEAMKTDADEEPLAPVYKPPLPGSSIDLTEVNKNYEGILSTSASRQPSPPVSRPKTPVSRGSSSFNLKNLTGPSSGPSRTSSSNSSPSTSRNVSSTNLTSLSSQNNINSNNNNNSIPIGTQTSGSVSPSHSTSGSGSLTPQNSSVAQPSSRLSDRNAALGGNTPIRSNSSLSLHNLHFLNKKKDKK